MMNQCLKVGIKYSLKYENKKNKIKKMLIILDKLSNLE